MLKLYYGPETYMCQQKKLKLINSGTEMDLFISKEWNSECEDFVSTFSMFGSKTLVLDIEELTKAYERVLAFKDLADIHIFAKKIDSRIKIFKTLEGSAEFFPKLGSNALKNFCLDNLKEFGCGITKEAFELLVRRSGYLVNNDVCLDTILIYLKQCAMDTNAITEETVLKFVPECADVKIWGLFDYLMNKDLKGFYRYFDRLVEQKETPIGILSLMLRNVRIGYKASLCGRDAAKTIGVQPAAIASTKRLSSAQLADLMELLQGAVNSIKSGSEPVLTVRVTAVKACDLF